MSPPDPMPPAIEVPAALAASQSKHEGESGRAWIAALPGLASHYLDHWRLRLDGPPAHGVASLVLPVTREDTTPAVLKLQSVTEETVGEPAGLRVWNGDGAVRLLGDEPGAGAMLLERLDASRPLTSVPDGTTALRILSELLARLVTVPAPEGLRTLADIAAAMLDQVPHALTLVTGPSDRRLLKTCAAAVGELLGEPGDRLLHWDLHYGNVLAALPDSGREPWLAIDPKPLAGDPGFDLLPAIDNRYADMAATGDLARAIRYRFDLMTEILGLDRQRAKGWTLGRVLQNALWDVEDGETAIHPEQAAIARALLNG